MVLPQSSLVQSTHGGLQDLMVARRL